MLKFLEEYRRQAPTSFSRSPTDRLNREDGGLPPPDSVSLDLQNYARLFADYDTDIVLVQQKVVECSE